MPSRELHHTQTLVKYTSFCQTLHKSMDSNARPSSLYVLIGRFGGGRFYASIRQKNHSQTMDEIRSEMNEQLREGANDVSNVVKRRYEKAADRLQDRRPSTSTGWLSPTATFLGGVGFGIGLGVMFAPVSGDEARAVLRDKVVDIKNKVSGVAV